MRQGQRVTRVGKFFNELSGRQAVANNQNPSSLPTQTSRDGFRARAGFGQEKFQRNEPLELKMAGGNDDPHAALPEHTLDTVLSGEHLPFGDQRLHSFMVAVRRAPVDLAASARKRRRRARPRRPNDDELSKIAREGGSSRSSAPNAHPRRQELSCPGFGHLAPRRVSLAEKQDAVRNVLFERAFEIAEVPDVLALDHEDHHLGDVRCVVSDALDGLGNRLHANRTVGFCRLALKPRWNER